MIKQLKLNIQLFAKEKDEDKAKEPTAEEIANLTIDLDLEKTAKAQALKDKEALEKQLDDERKANARLMKRISEKDEKDIKQEESYKNKHAKITDLYDWEKGRLVLKD